MSTVKASSSAQQLPQNASDEMAWHCCLMKLALFVFGLTIPPEN